MLGGVVGQVWVNQRYNHIDPTPKPTIKSTNLGLLRLDQERAPGLGFLQLLLHTFRVQPAHLEGPAEALEEEAEAGDSGGGVDWLGL